MDGRFLAACLVVVVMMVYLPSPTPAPPVLPCSSCDNVTCGDPPQGCELDKIPCGCCPSCVRRDGELCEAFSPSCAKGLQCITPGGTFDKRPPWYQSFLKGVCVPTATA